MGNASLWEKIRHVFQSDQTATMSGYGQSFCRVPFAVFHFYALESPGKHLVAIGQLRKSYLY